MSSAQRAAQRPITEKITDRNHEERKPLDASPAAITLAMLLTDEELDSVRGCDCANRDAGDVYGQHDGMVGGSPRSAPQGVRGYLLPDRLPGSD